MHSRSQIRPIIRKKLDRSTFGILLCYFSFFFFFPHFSPEGNWSITALFLQNLLQGGPKIGTQSVTKFLLERKFGMNFTTFTRKKERRRRGKLVWYIEED